MKNRSPRLATLGAFALAVGLVAGCSSSSPAGTPVEQSLSFMGGDATVQMTGGYTLSYPARFLRGNLFGAGGAFMSVQYGNVQTGALTYQGPATVGAYPTTRTATTVVTLALTVVLPSGPKASDSFASTNGECTVTITKAEPGGGAATFTCTNLANIDGSVKVDATGTFNWIVPVAKSPAP